MSDVLRIRAHAAVTLDGKIARHHHELTTWTSVEDKQVLRSALQEADGIIVGRTTFEVSRLYLEKYRCLVLTRSVAGLRVDGPRLTYLNADKLDPLEYLAGEGWQNAALLGGAETYTYFFSRGLVHELFLTIEPVSFGEGVPLHYAKDVPAPKLIDLRQLNEQGSVLLHYRYG